MDWQLQTAKARLSEVVQRAIDEGPQRVTRRGQPAVVIVSETEYRRLVRPRKSLKQLLTELPLDGVEIVRSEDTGRDVEF